MKTSAEMYEEAKEREVQELYDAIKKHGGEVHFESDFPVVYYDYEDALFNVKAVCINEDNEIEILTEDVEEDFEIQLSPYEIGYGECNGIVEVIEYLYES